MSNGRKIDSQGPTNPPRDARGVPDEASLGRYVVSGRRRIDRSGENEPPSGNAAQRPLDEYVRREGAGSDPRALGLISGRRRIEPPPAADMRGVPAAPVQEDRKGPMRIPQTPPPGAVPPGESDALPRMTRDPSQEVTGVWRPRAAPLAAVEMPTVDDLPGRMSRSGVSGAAAASPVPAQLDAQDSWDRLMAVGPAADAQSAGLEQLSEDVDTRSDMERLLDDKGRSFFDYVDGRVAREHMAHFIKEIAALRYPLHSPAKAIENLGREVGRDLRSHVYPEHGGFDLPPEDILHKLEESMNMADYERERFREQHRFAQLSWDETIDKVEWERKSDRSLERMLRLIQLKRPGRHFRHRPRDVIASVKDHVRRGKGAYADENARYRQSIKGSYPLDSMTDWIAFGFLAELPSIDVLQTVLNASWGSERLLVPLKTKRSNYRIFEQLKEKSWKAPDLLTPKAEGRALVDAAIEAEAAGELKTAAVLYTMLAEMQYRDREEAEGYYDYTKELIELKTRRPDTENSAFEESFQRGRARVVQSFQRRAVQREALAFDTSAGIQANDDRAMVADILEQSPELIDMSVGATTSTGLHRIDSRDEQRIASLMKKGRGWVHPYRETRRFLYGIVAAHKWLAHSRSLPSGDSHDAFRSCERASEALDLALWRFYVLRNYDSDELGVSLGKLINPVSSLMSDLQIEVALKKDHINQRTLSIVRSLSLPPREPPRRGPPSAGVNSQDMPTSAGFARRGGEGGNDPGVNRHGWLDHAAVSFAGGIMQPARAWITGLNIFSSMSSPYSCAFGRR